MSLRWRLTGALLLVVIAAVTGGTAAHLVEISRRLEATLAQQTDRVANSIRTEIEQTGEVLDDELRYAQSLAFLESSLGASGQARYLGATARLRAGRLEVLKVLAPDGTILISGAWPASFGAVDPSALQYAADPGPVARILDEATQAGSAPALERWGKARWRGRDLTVVAGRFLDQTALERMRARVGADVVALCRKGEQRCVATMKRKNDRGVRVVFDPRSDWFRQRYRFADVPLGDGGGPARMITGVDRSALDSVREGIVWRALIVGGVSIVFSMLLGGFLAARIVRPVEALADGAKRLSEGELTTQVAVDQGGTGKEVSDLVTTFNQMARDIAASQVKLRQAERVAAWREIARGLAHELKNPLTPILGAMDVIKKARRIGREDFDEILVEQADAVVEEVMRLKELSDAFARFARLPEPSPEPLDMRVIVDNATALYVPDSNAVTIERDFQENLATVLADKTQMATAVTNLVKNAVEAMNAEGTLRLHLSADARRLRFVVEDSGPGIAPEIRDRLFTPYVTTKGSRGTGLGLALVHRIVGEHQGEIEVGTSWAGGARFELNLPLKPAVALKTVTDALA